MQVGQFAIVAHEPHEHGATVGIAKGNGTGAEVCELFALAEGTTPAAHEFAGHLISQAERTWKSLNLSLTGALIEIFREAQHSLMEWNTRSISQHRVGLGLGCLARQGDKIVLAIRGPATILHSSADSITVYEPDEEHIEPMDGLEPDQPQLMSLPLAPGDRVLLVTTNITESLSEELLAEILGRSLGEILPNLYRRITHLRDAAVLLVGVPSGDEQLLLPPESSPTQEKEEDGPVIGGESKLGNRSIDFQASLFIQASSQGGTLADARKRLKEVDAQSRVNPDLTEITAFPPTQELPALKKAVGESEGAHHPATDTNRTPSDHSFFKEMTQARQAPAPSLASHHTNAAPVSKLAADRRMQIAATTNVPTSGRLTMAPSMANAVVRVRRSMGPGRRNSGYREGISGGLSPATWILILIGIVLLAGIISWATLPSLFTNDEAGRLSQLIEEAKWEIATASEVDQASLRREALTRARGLLLEAMVIEGGPSSADLLLQQAQRELAALDAIVSPRSIQALADLRGFGETPVAVRQLVVSDSDAYVLDAAGAQIISISLSTGKKTTVFAASMETPFAPTAITYADVSRPGGSALLIADEGGSLWAWSPTGWVSKVELAGSMNLTITDMHYEGGSLYLLDAPRATIFRFLSTPSGFTFEPVVVHQLPELTTARHLIVDNGDLFTAHQDGSIRHFNGAFTLLLSQEGIDIHLTQAATPHMTSPASEVVILDKNNDRIVILARDGSFIRQYRHDDFEDLTAFTMRDGFGYVVSGEKLRRITF